MTARRARRGGTIAMVIVAVILFLTGCAPHKGTIVAKNDQPPYTSVSIVSTGKTLVPIVTYHPEVWSLDIKNDKDEGWVSVNQAYYNSVNVGDYVDLDGDN